MVNKTNFCPDVLILRSYFYTAERFTLSNRVSTNAIETLAKMIHRIGCIVLETQSFKAI